MKQIDVKGALINITGVEDNDYISLTDIAKLKANDNSNAVISNWLRRVDTLEFLTIWERINNQDFKPLDFEGFKSKPGTNAFTISPQKWAELSNAIGIKVKAGRHGGGTFAHRDIALEFAGWISPEIKLYIIKEFQRLKNLEAEQQDWNSKRLLTKVNYLINTESIKNNLIQVELTPEQKNYIYASEADLLNVALFGLTAKQWKDHNQGQKGNVRDYTSTIELAILSNLEYQNAKLIEAKIDQRQRLISLNEEANREKDLFNRNTAKALFKSVKKNNSSD